MFEGFSISGLGLVRMFEGWGIKGLEFYRVRVLGYLRVRVG